jgi:hypothetical protein
MENTIENAEKFLDELIEKVGQPMNSSTRIFWSDVLESYGKKILEDGTAVCIKCGLEFQVGICSRCHDKSK